MPNSKFEMIHISKLRMNEFNVRKFEANMTPQRQARFDELAASVASVGILEPLVVRQCGIEFEIIAGERRYRAARVAKLDMIPCMIRVATDVEAFDLMVIENLQRDDLTPFETAMAFRLYFDRHGSTPDAVTDLSLRTGIPVSAIRRLVRLLDLPDDVVKAWRDGDITQTHAELLTRVGDPVAASELLALCQRSKLSTRELAERIGAAACDLERGFFDKTECQACPDNTSVQSGLFSDLTPGGKCSNPGCFEEKQAAYFTGNWSNSKPAQMFGTCGFRFGHRLGPDYRWLPAGREAAERCRTCETFVSVLRLTGAVVSGYSQTCIGPRACFDELYAENLEPETKPAESETKPEKTETSAPEKALPAVKTETKPPPAAAKTPEKKTPAAETGPVFDGGRGERHRKSFIKDRLMVSESGILSHRLSLLALAIRSVSAKMRLAEYGIPSTATELKIAEAIFEIHPDQLIPATHEATVACIMGDGDNNTGIWPFVADRFGIDVAHEWSITETYLVSLNKSEIVRIGEEPGVGIWVDPAAVTYRQEKYKGKALMALKKEELIDIILKSGAELAGRVPAEVLGKKKG